MKRMLALLLCMSLALAAIGGAVAEAAPDAAKPAYTPGTYTATARGMYSDVTVAVTVDESAIVSVEVTEQNDTRRIAAAAVETVPARIVAAQSLAVDTASGATMTSFGILNAAKAALSEAGADMDALTAPIDKTPATLPEESYDVVIVGGGGAGLAAAVEIGKNSDLSVLVLEKAAYTGGSTALSGGLILVGGTSRNGVDGVLDFTPEEFLDYFKKRAGEMSRRPEDMWINEELVLRIGQTAGPAFTYYMDEGIDLGYTYPSVQWSETGGLTGFINGAPGAEGAAKVWGDWFTALAEKNGAEIRVNANVTSLLSADGAAEGVTVESPEGSYQVKAKSVLLACGGYGNNIPMLAALNPDVPNIETAVSYTVPTDKGDFFALTDGLNAAQAGYGHINVLGAGPGQGYHTEAGMMALIGFNVWVNKEGARFANEKEYPPYHVSFEIFKQTDGVVYGVADSDMVYTDGNTGRDAVAVFEDAVASGLAYKGETVEELAGKIGVDAAGLAATLEKYNADCEAGNGDTLYGQPAAAMSPVSVGPFYALRIYPTVLGTIGGLEANANCQIMNLSGQPIPNLYGAGEVIFGNVFLEEYYASGCGVSTAVYTGVIAGEEIAKALQ